MNSRLPYFLLLFLPVLSFAQAPVKKGPASVEWSSPENGSAKYWYARVLGQSAQGVYLLKSNLTLDHNEQSSGIRTRKYAIAFYDQNLAWRWEKPLVLPDKLGRFEKFAFLSDKVLTLYSLEGKRSEPYLIKAFWFDQNNADAPVPLPFAELPAGRYERDMPLTFVHSLDHALFASAALLRPDGAGEEQTAIHVTVCNSRLEKVYSGEIGFQGKSSATWLQNMHLSLDSIVFFAAPGQAKGQAFSICSFDIKTGKKNMSVIDLGDKKVSEYIFSLDEANRRLVVTGLYSDQGLLSAAGIFYASVSYDGLMTVKVSTHPFTSDFMNLFIGEPKTADKKELLNYRVNKTLLRRDGGGLMMSESTYLTDYSYYDFFTKSYITKTVYHNDNILLVSIGPSGELLWERVVAKKQESQEDEGYYLSYIPVNAGGKLHLLFNSSEGKFNNVMAYSFNDKGEETRTVITEISEEATIIPRAGRQVGRGTVIIPGFRKSRFYLCRISF